MLLDIGEPKVSGMMTLDGKLTQCDRSWSKPDTSPNAQPRYRLTIQGGTGDVWLLLSQHLVSKDRAIDDIALHVVEEHSGEILASRPEQHEVMVCLYSSFS